MDKDNKEEKPMEVETSSALDDIAGGEMPEVKENAIAAVQDQKQVEIESAVKEGFDPEIHVTNADGTPALNKNGSFKKKRGRKKGSTVKSKSQLNLSVNEPQIEEPVMGSLEAAITISGLLEAAQVKMISDEFIYEELERQGNIEAWKRTLDHYGGLNLTPPQTLVLSHLQIIVSRAMSPDNKKTKEKFALFGTWFKSKISNIKFRKKDKKDGARSDNRKDTKRENNPSNEDGKSQAKAGNKSSGS